MWWWRTKTNAAVGTGLGVGTVVTSLLWMIGVSTGPVGFSILFLAGGGVYLTADALQNVEAAGMAAAYEAKTWSDTGKALLVAGSGFFAAAAGSLILEDGSGVKTAIVNTGAGTCVSGLGAAAAIQLCR